MRGSGEITHLAERRFCRWLPVFFSRPITSASSARRATFRIYRFGNMYADMRIPGSRTRRVFSHPSIGPKRQEDLMSAAEMARNAKAESVELKSFGKPDDVRTFPKGRLELVTIGGATIGRAVFEPGWRWATSVQPIAQTKSCEAPHFQYHVSGILRIKMDDGMEFDCRPGDVSLLPSGHDAWVVGEEPAVVVDFHGMVEYAKGAATSAQS
jgi:hypothetical protein